MCGVGFYRFLAAYNWVNVWSAAGPRASPAHAAHLRRYGVRRCARPARKAVCKADAHQPCACMVRGLLHPAVQALLDVSIAPPQQETLAANWAHELADAMADVLVNQYAPPVVQLQQL